MRTAAIVAREERGFALLAVTLVLALMVVVVSEFAFSMRLQAAMVRSFKDAVLARHLAEAGLQQAIREVLSDAAVHGLNEDGQVVFYQVPPGGGVTPTRLPELPRSHVKLGVGEFSYWITDEESRININSGQPDRLDRLLNALGVEKTARDTITDSVEDWRDPNEVHRTNGAESDDYLKLPVPYRSRNANFQDIAELLQIKGVTPELYYGQGDQPGLVDLVTVRSRGTVNMNTASKLVLRAAGLSEAELGEITQSRTSTPYGAVPPRYSGRRLTVGSATFRIEAVGIIGGEVRARMVTIAQRIVMGAQLNAPPALVVYSWRSLPPTAVSKEKEGAGKAS
jgi:type II secretory pathway component PulK